MESKEKNSYRLLVVIFSTTTLLDTINGLFTMINFSSGQQIIPIVRLLITIYLLVILFNEKKQYFLLSQVFIQLTFLSVIYNHLVGSQESISFYRNINYSLKFIYFFNLILVLVTLINNKKMTVERLRQSILNNAYVFPFLILLPSIWNLNRVTYQSSNVGNMGVFISNNATNITMIILLTYLLQNFLIATRYKGVKFGYFLLMLVVLILQGSRTSLFFSILMLFFLVLYFYMFRLLKFFFIGYKINVLYLFALIVLTGGVFVYTYYQASNQYPLLKFITKMGANFIERQNYYFQKNSFWGYITSNRNLKLIQGLTIYLDNFNIWTFFFGVGTDFQQNVTKAIIEMDIVDIALANGILGLVQTYGTTLYFVWKPQTTNQTKFTKNEWMVAGLILISLIYSVVAGHVFTDIMPSTLLALMVASLYGEKKNQSAVAGNPQIATE